MHGKFFTFRGGFNGWLPGFQLAPNGDDVGNYWSKTKAPRRGERPEDWIRREITEQLVNTVPLPFKQGPWWKLREFTVNVRWDGRGEYLVSVVPYVVDLSKSPTRSAMR